MSTRAKPLGWAQTTIDRAISLRRLIQITRAARDVELRSPAKQCPECGESVDLIVIPSEVCGSCWSTCDCELARSAGEDGGGERKSDAADAPEDQDGPLRVRFGRSAVVRKPLGDGSQANLVHIEFKGDRLHDAQACVGRVPA